MPCLMALFIYTRAFPFVYEYNWLILSCYTIVFYTAVVLCNFFFLFRVYLKDSVAPLEEKKLLG